MKTIITITLTFIIVRCSTYYETRLERIAYNQVDSAKVELSQIKKDKILYRMVSDAPYRTKILFLSNVLTDNELAKLYNKKNRK